MALAPARPAIKLKAGVKLPAIMAEGPGIDITRTNGTYTIGLDYPSLTNNAGIPDPSIYRLAIYNTSTSEYEEAPLDQLRSTTVAAVRTPRGDADYTMISTDRYVGLTAALTAPRTWSLPSAAAVVGGTQIDVKDEAGGISATNTLTITASGAETINGAASFVLNVAYAGARFISDGTSKWTLALVGTTGIAPGALAATTAGLAKMADGYLAATAAGRAKMADGFMFANAFPTAYDTVDLPAIRRRLRNIPDLGDYGITSSGVTNYGQSDFTAMMAGLVADGYREVLCPGGNYRLDEQIQFEYGAVLVGEHKSTTVFKMYHSGTGFVFTGSLENGGALRRLSVVNDSGAQATAYFQAIAAVGGTSPDFFLIEDCNFTGFSAATVQYGLIFDGNARDGTAPNGLVGVRDIQIRGTTVFNCDVYNTDLRQARGFHISGLEHYQGDGAVTKLRVSGASSLKPSASVRIDGSILGDVTVQYASKVIGLSNDVTTCTVTSDASNCVIGTAYSTVTNSSTSSIVIGNS